MANVVSAVTNVAIRPRAIERPTAAAGAGHNGRNDRSEQAPSSFVVGKEPVRQPDGLVPILLSESKGREPFQAAAQRRAPAPYEDVPEVKHQIDVLA
jgi:hypothetical protein